MLLVLTISITIFSSSVSIADTLDSAREKLTKTNTVLKKSQKKIKQLNEDTHDINDQYKATLRESSLYQTYNSQLSEIIDTQEKELNSLSSQIDEIEVTAKQIMPLMKDMIDTLEEFIRLDLPFLQDERTRRITSLKDNMRRADLTVSEKYRKILEAYQIEMEYGETLESYQAPLDGMTVNFVKIGRTAFFSQSLDKSTSQVWDKHNNAWRPVASRKVIQSISKAIKISLKQAPPELLTVLVNQPGEQP